MTTQKRSVGRVAASVAVGLIIVLVLGLASSLVSGGFSFGSASGGAAVSGESGTAASEESDAAASDGSGSFREITDSVGRKVQVPEYPRHVACYDPFSGNVMVLIGAGSQLTGVPGGVKSNVLLQRISENLAQVDQLTGSTINIESLVSANTDLVFVKRSLYDADGEVAKLDKMGIPYVVVDYETVDQQIAAIELIGQICAGDAQEKAKRLVEYYRSTVELVEQRVSQVSDDQKVKVYHSINDPLLTDGTGSLGADWIARTGCVDVSADSESTGGEGDYTATLEQIYQWNPGLIICNTADAAKTISSDRKWAGLQAVSDGKVSNLPVSTSRWGQRGDPETFLAMLWLGKTAYPDLFSDIDLKETVVSYYQDVVGISIDDQTWDAIVAGESLRASGNGSNESGV